LGCAVHILYLSTFLIESATVLCISLTEMSSYYAFAYLFSFSLSAELLENPIAGIFLLYSLFFGPQQKIDYRVANNDNELFVAVTAQMNTYVDNPGILEQNVVINTDACVHKTKYA